MRKVYRYIIKKIIKKLYKYNWSIKRPNIKYNKLPKKYSRKNQKGETIAVTDFWTQTIWIVRLYNIKILLKILLHEYYHAMHHKITKNKHKRYNKSADKYSIKIIQLLNNNKI